MFFFFQAEDGIRDLTVTGVQTCALPIYPVRRSHRHRARALMRAFFVLALLVPVRLAAQQGNEGNAVEGAARLRVVTATVPISLDGRLDGPAWANADSITDFRQREPSSGTPASERTVVKV